MGTNGMDNEKNVLREKGQKSSDPDDYLNQVPTMTAKWSQKCSKGPNGARNDPKMVPRSPQNDKKWYQNDPK